MWRTFAKRTETIPVMPRGRRVYAIGDVHGRLDLLDRLLDMLSLDNAARASAEVTVILLGDLIDRGPDSAGVIRRAMRNLDWGRLICLKGNHEAAMEGALGGDAALARLWIRMGGDATLRSWGVSTGDLTDDAIEGVMTEARSKIPGEVRDWIAERPISYQIGDYYFVHAGVRPGVPLERQTAEDQLWIRMPFLKSRLDHGAMIVHGHSIEAGVEEQANRIGIDTGAFASGRLTAMAAEDSERWFLQSSLVSPMHVNLSSVTTAR